MPSILHTSDLLQKSPVMADTVVYFHTYQQFWIFNGIIPYNMVYIYQFNFERHFE